MRTGEVTSTALLLLELYGLGVVFDTPAAIDRFLEGADLIDKFSWRQALLAVRTLKPALGDHSIH